eukprot:1416849-Pyramimonas_sp.AAC.1
MGPSVELPMGHKTLYCLGPAVELHVRPRHAVLGWVGETHADTTIGACGGAPHGATARCIVWGNTCGHRNRGLRWSSL